MRRILGNYWSVARRAPFPHRRTDGVPDPDHAVAGSGGKPTAIWAECNGMDISRVPARLTDFAAPGNVKQAAAADANDVLYSLKSSDDYDPEPDLRSIKAKVFALNFADDEFNASGLPILERLMPQIQDGCFVIQPGTETSFGHLTIARPELWASHVVEFLRELGDTP
jgi:hypothetical protein